jgi:hypothetical protein
MIEELLSGDSAGGRTKPEQQTGSEPAALCAAGPPAIPGYEVLGVLGHGGMGVVYRARQIGANRVVALKMIRAFEHASPTEQMRFQIETEAVARLQHPHIVQLYEVGEVRGQPFFSLEYCDGGTLTDLLKKQRPTPREAAQLIETLARAMHYAHLRGVVHRDLKPANVLLVGEERTPKITDFGLAKRIDAEARDVSQSGAIMGTASYMAPEQAAGKVRDTGPAADVYALGALLYECLTGRPPFEGPQHLILVKVLSDEPEPPSRRAPTPADLATICLKCLSKEPARRYASAADLADDLRRFQADEPILARPVGWIGRGMKWVRRRPVIAALSTAVVVAMVAGTAVSLHFGLRAQAKEKEARDALGAVEETLAVGLLRPLGHLTTEKVLNPFELDALEYLASLPRERDRVRVLFLDRALRAPGTTGQLDRRLEEALIAAVGLRSDLREQVMEEAAARLEDAGTSREAKVVSARILAQLRCDKESLVLSTAAILEEDMMRSIHAMHLVAVSADLAIVAGKLPVEQAAALAERLVEQAEKSRVSSPGAGRALSEVFAAVADKVPAAQARTLAGRLITLARTGKLPPELPSKVATAQAAHMATCFSGLAGKLPPELASKVATALAARIGEIAGKAAEDKATELASLVYLSKHFAELAGKLPAGQAGKWAPQLAGRIVEVVARPPRDLFQSDEGKGFMTGLAALMGSIDPEDVREIIDSSERLEFFLRKEAGKQEGFLLRGYHSPIFAALAVNLPVEQASELAARIVVLATWETDPFTLAALSVCLGSMVAKLPAEGASKHVVELAGRLLKRVPKKAQAFFGIDKELRVACILALARKVPAEQASMLTRRLAELLKDTIPPTAQDVMVKCFAALEGKLHADQSGALAGRIVEIEEQWTDHWGDSPGMLDDEGWSCDPGSAMVVKDVAVRCFVALAGNLPAEQASKLGARIVERAATKSNAEQLAALCECFCALANKVPAEQADTLAGRIVELAAKKPSLASLRTLAHALGSLPGRRKQGEVAGLILRLARLSHQDRTWKDGSISLHRLLSQVDSQTILDALKQPGCVGTTRADLLAHLSQRYNRPGATLWELIDYLREQAPELDLDSPLRIAGPSGDAPP